MCVLGFQCVLETMKKKHWLNDKNELKFACWKSEIKVIIKI